MNRDQVVEHILAMNSAMIDRVKTKDEDAIRKGQADDSPLLKALESRNVAKVAMQLQYWYEKATKNGHYKKGGHRFLVNLINRLVELFPGDELGTYVGRSIQMQQPEFTYYLLAGIAYKVSLAGAFNRDGDQCWSPAALADKILPRLEVSLVDLFINKVSSFVGNRTSHAINAAGRGYHNREQTWKKVRGHAVTEALELLHKGKGGMTAAGLEALNAPLDAMFPPDAVDDRGRNLYDLKQAVLFIIVEALCYHLQEGEAGFNEVHSSHRPFLLTRQDNKNKYSRREIRVNPTLKQAKDKVLARIMLDADALEPLEEDDDELLADFCFVYKATGYEPEPWRYTGEPDRLNRTGGFADATLRALCSLHKKRGSECDSISSEQRIDFINKLQATTFEVNKPVLELAKYLRGECISIDGLASKHHITQYDVKFPSDITCVKEPRLAAKRDALVRYEQEAVSLGLVLPRELVPIDDVAAVAARERILKDHRNGDAHGEEWKNIRKGVTALSDEIHSQNDNADTTKLSLEELTRLSGMESFHYVVQVDGRMRVYFVAANSSPMAGNVNRWCHQFHEGKPLTDSGWKELKLALGTAVLGNKLSINERRAYAEENLQKFTDWGRDLVGNEREIRHLGPDEFWYFCALCSGLAEYEVSGMWKVPVSRDAAASGLGWWSVLTGDELGAKMCNLIDTTDDSAASDTYMHMLEIVKGWVDERNPQCVVARKIGKSKKPTRKKFSQDEWLLLDELFSSPAALRKAAKAVVMLGSYGAGHQTILGDIQELLPELGDMEQAFLTVNLSKAMQKVFSGCYSTMLALKDAYSGGLVAKSGERSEELMNAISDERKALAEQIKEQKLFVADYDASQSEDDQLYDAFGEYESKHISPIKARIRKLEAELAAARYEDEVLNGAITWTQVDGSVIHHCKLLATVSNLSLPGHGEIKFTRYHANTRDGQKARVAVSPDFIHSCDSQQLAMAFRNMPFDGYAIHDCAYLHPSDMEEGLRLLKEAMVTIVAENPLAKVLQEWGVDAEFPQIDGFAERVMASSLYWN